MLETLLLFAAALAGDSGDAGYSRRNGTAEARTAARSGKVQLYSHVRNGRAPRAVTPGIRRYTPLEGGRLHHIVFLPLPEADWGEGYPYPEEWYARATEAITFARAYNREMFKLKSRLIRKACPQVELEP